MNNNGLEWGTLTELLVAICSIIAIIISSFVSWRLFKSEPAQTYVQERYEKIIFPVFQLMEKHMFEREITDEIVSVIKICQTIVNDNQMIAGGKLIELFWCPLTNKSFQAISYEIDRQYDKACKQLGIPTRTILFKAMIYKWRCRKINILFAIKYIVLPSFLFLMLFIALVILSRLYQ